MRLKVVSPTVDSSHHAFFQSFAPSSLFISSFRLRSSEMDAHLSLAALSNPFASKTLFKSRSLNKISRGNAIRRSSSLNLDGVFSDVPSFRVQGSAKNSDGADSGEEEGNKNKKKLYCATSKNSPFLGRQGRDQDPFSNSRFDFLEPMMLGIKPEFPDWPDQETAMWATMEQKAKSLDIPLSLRMIKKKLQWEEGFADCKESGSGYCSVKAAFASMVFIIVELQSCALHMREELCHEDLEVITCKVQKEMHSSFVWLFQQVFSRTPALMLHVMILLADFGVHSASYNTAIAEASLLGALVEPSMNTGQRQTQQHQQINVSSSPLVTENGNGGGAVEEKAETGDLPQSSENPSAYQSDQLGSVAEMNLWNSMVDEAAKMREGGDDDDDEEVEVLDHDTMQHFVSPWSVELEPDTHEDYQRTDLLYQMNLSQDPDNPLLLCNYAQFLYLVARDHDRAEECFKRAVQVVPFDPETAAQYANFLWTVRQDFWAAEERFLQALTTEPGNPYFASRYASFLWHTGGEETCFPLNNSNV